MRPGSSPTIIEAMKDSVNAERHRDGRTPLHYAALKDDLGTATRLIGEGANPNVADRAGLTPLHFAAQEGSLSVARALLEGGADVSAEDRHGNTPLWTAVFNSRGRGDIITLLRDRGADPSHRNQHGKTPFDLAQTIANYPVAQWFDDLAPSGKVSTSE